MDEDAVADLKQFITVTITQQTTDLRQDMTGLRRDVSSLRSDVKRIDNKIDDLSAAVAEALDASNKVRC